MKLEDITPQSETEQSILTELLELEKLGLTLISLQDDLSDAPDEYDFTQDDLAQFLFANNIATYPQNEEYDPAD